MKEKKQLQVYYRYRKLIEQTNSEGKRKKSLKMPVRFEAFANQYSQVCPTGKFEEVREWYLNEFPESKIKVHFLSEES